MAVHVLMGSLVASAAMSAVAQPPSGHCRIIDVGKTGAANAATICAEVERAIAQEEPHVPYSVEIKILSPSSLSATLIVQGRSLPVQNFAVMDRDLSLWSIRNFAAGLAQTVSKAAKL